MRDVDNSFADARRALHFRRCSEAEAAQRDVMRCDDERADHDGAGEALELDGAVDATSGSPHAWRHLERATDLARRRWPGFRADGDDAERLKAQRHSLARSSRRISSAIDGRTTECSANLPDLPIRHAHLARGDAARGGADGAEQRATGPRAQAHARGGENEDQRELRLLRGAHRRPVPGSRRRRGYTPPACTQTSASRRAMSTPVRSLISLATRYRRHPSRRGPSHRQRQLAHDHRRPRARWRCGGVVLVRLGVAALARDVLRRGDTVEAKRRRLPAGHPPGESDDVAPHRPEGRALDRSRTLDQHPNPC